MNMVVWLFSALTRVFFFQRNFVKLIFGCSAIDFPTGSDPASAFALQKEYNPLGMAPSLTA